MSPPWIWPSTIIGLIRTPQSSTATNLRIDTFAVSGSTSTTQMYAPNGNVRFGGSYTVSASSPASTPSGSSTDPRAAIAISWIVAPCSGSPFTYQRPFSQARSSGATSSIAEATSRARSRTLRATIAVAAPLTGVDREP